MNETQRRPKLDAHIKNGMPVCQDCGKTGSGVQFNIFSPYGFGVFCVPCEKHQDQKGGQ